VRDSIEFLGIWYGMGFGTTCIFVLLTGNEIVSERRLKQVRVIGKLYDILLAGVTTKRLLAMVIVGRALMFVGAGLALAASITFLWWLWFVGMIAIGVGFALICGKRDLRRLESVELFGR